MALVGSAESRANEAERLGQALGLNNRDGSDVAIGDHADSVLLEEEARGLRDVSGRVVESEIGIEIGAAGFGDDLAVLVVVELVDHDAIIGGEITDEGDDGGAEKRDVTTREGLETGNGTDGELLRLDCAADGEDGVIGAGGFEIDDDADVDAVEDRVEGFGGWEGVEEERV